LAPAAATHGRFQRSAGTQRRWCACVGGVDLFVVRRYPGTLQESPLYQIGLRRPGPGFLVTGRLVADCVTRGGSDGGVGWAGYRAGAVCTRPVGVQPLVGLHRLASGGSPVSWNLPAHAAETGPPRRSRSSPPHAFRGLWKGVWFLRPMCVIISGNLPSEPTWVELERTLHEVS